MNKVNLVGRLTKEPQVQYTKSGIPCMQNNVAIDRGYGETKKTDFIPVVIWKGEAEYIGQRANKGSMVAISGSIQTRQYQGQDGQNKYVVEVVVENIQILDKFKENGNQQVQQPQASVQNQQVQQSAYQQPVGQTQQPQTVPSTYNPNPTNVEINDDDLPF